MATHFGILAWGSPWTGVSGHSPWGLIEPDTTEVTKHSTYALLWSIEYWWKQ